MAIRSISDIKADISELSIKLSSLRKELDEIKEMCPHPDHFVTKSTSQEEDEYGHYINEYNVRYECSLCEGSFYSSFKNNPNKPYFGDPIPPTLQEILNKQK